MNTIISHFQQHTSEVGTISGEYFGCYCFDWSKIRQRKKAGSRLASDSICCLHVQGQLRVSSDPAPKLLASQPRRSSSGAQSLSAPASSADLEVPMVGAHTDEMG